MPICQKRFSYISRGVGAGGGVSSYGRLLHIFLLCLFCIYLKTKKKAMFTPPPPPPLKKSSSKISKTTRAIRSRQRSTMRTLSAPPTASTDQVIRRTLYLFGSHQRRVALVAYAFERRATARRAAAPPGVELPHVRAARRAHQLQALPAMVPPATFQEISSIDGEWGRLGRR